HAAPEVLRPGERDLYIVTGQPDEVPLPPVAPGQHEHVLDPADHRLTERPALPRRRLAEAPGTLGHDAGFDPARQDGRFGAPPRRVWKDVKIRERQRLH